MRNILQICAFGAPNPGNFIPSLLMLQSEMESHGYETIYAFPEKAKGKNWCIELCKKNKVYFLPEAKARIKPETYKKVRKIYNENDIDIVHSHFELYDIPAALMAPKNVKIFWHLHDTVKQTYKNSNFLYKFLFKLQYGTFSKRVVMLSTSKVHSDFTISLGFNKDNIHILPNGIDLKRILNSSGIKKNREFAMFCWDFYRKGGDLAEKAAKLLWEKRKDFCVKFIPGGNILENEYLVKGDICNDINKIYGSAGCFLHISRSEGLSYALLEAIYSGLPVICSDIPENMIVADCPTVKYVKSENIEQIADAMNYMLDMDFKISKNDIEESRKIIESRYSLETWCKNIIKEYLA